MSTVNLTIELSDDQAEAVAQFIKRAHSGTYDELANPRRADEAELMASGFNVIAAALATAGYDPR